MPSLILKRPWSIKKPEDKLIKDLSEKLCFPKSITSYLVSRGLLTRDQIESHLDTGLSSLSEPLSMKGMNRAVKRLMQAVKKREKTGIFGDYDADGVTSSALIFLFLKELRVDSAVYIPHRENEGYGMNREGLDYLHAEGCSLVITVDCGISDFEEAQYAAQLGIDLIITDHHRPGERLPECLSLINPRQPGCGFPFKELAGVGVAFNLVRALRSALYRAGFWNGSRPPNLRRYLDLVAIGTVSDIMPLFGDNRIMVKAGLHVLEEGKRPGINALKRTSSLSGSITSTDLGFRLGPRINAAGRIDHAMASFNLLISNDPVEAETLAGKLSSYNRQRQNEERQILNQAMAIVREMGQRESYILESSDWKLGIIGIVASKIMKQVNRPVILLTEDGDEAVGSGRCPDWLDLFSMLTSCSSCLIRYGGHKAAAGVRLSLERLDDFSELFDQQCRKSISEGHEAAVLDIDCRVHISEFFNPEYPVFLEMLEPFGPGYSSPLFSMENFLVKNSRIVGKSHLKLTVSQETGAPVSGPGIDMMAWGQGDKLSYPWHEMEIVFSPGINNWRGRKNLQLVLKDARPRGA